MLNMKMGTVVPKIVLNTKLGKIMLNTKMGTVVPKILLNMKLGKIVLNRIRQNHAEHENGNCSLKNSYDS